MSHSAEIEKKKIKTAMQREASEMFSVKQQLMESMQQRNTGLFPVFRKVEDFGDIYSKTREKEKRRLGRNGIIVFSSF